MLFNSLEFWVFFPIVFCVYSVLSHRWQNRALLVASYVFYGWWDPRFLSLIFISTLVDYVVGLELESCQANTRRRWLLLSVVTNLGLLGIFKYLGFFAESAQSCLEALGFTVHPWELSIILPVGISFYTFQTLSYTVGIYRKRLKPTRDFLDFSLFVAFFPQLVAGPIERAETLIPQIQAPRKMTWERWCEGVLLVAIGLFKKVAVADTLAPLVEQTFADPSRYAVGSLVFGVYCFSFQIYADFSGYTDIARGLARILGFDLMKNFDQPYFSASVTEFWRRWHISLSTWLRDHLYIPLGGNRLGHAKTIRNLALTMLLGGLWHGAAWTFVAWGGLHALYLVVHKAMLGDSKPALIPSKTGVAGMTVYVLKCLAVFHLIALTWVFFRAETFGQAFDILAGIATLQGMGAGDAFLRLESRSLREAVYLILALVILVDIPQYVGRSHTVFLSWRTPWRILAFTVLLLVSLLLAAGDSREFIYFQF